MGLRGSYWPYEFQRVFFFQPMIFYSANTYIELEKSTI